MSTHPLLNPAPTWVPPYSRFVELHHGCADNDAIDIRQNGIDLSKCRTDTDFGQGFYTTTILRQAQHWAWYRALQRGHPQVAGYSPVVLTFRLDRHRLSKLWTLSFVLGDYHRDDFWSLVQHCRQSGPRSPNDHHGPRHTSSGFWYDLVCGPVSAFWPQRVAMVDADQFSFHTDVAVKLLKNFTVSQVP